MSGHYAEAFAIRDGLMNARRFIEGHVADSSS
jgi:hypothetical protein